MVDVTGPKIPHREVNITDFRSDGLVLLNAQVGHTYKGCARAPAYTDMELRVTATGTFYDLIKFDALTAAAAIHSFGGKW